MQNGRLKFCNYGHDYEQPQGGRYEAATEPLEALRRQPAVFRREAQSSTLQLDPKHGIVPDTDW